MDFLQTFIKIYKSYEWVPFPRRQGTGYGDYASSEVRTSYEQHILLRNRDVMYGVFKRSMQVTKTLGVHYRGTLNDQVMNTDYDNE